MQDGDPDAQGPSQDGAEMRGQADLRTVKFTSSTAADSATLSRAGVVYGRGESVAVGGGSELVLAPRRPLRPGAYTLTVGAREHGRWVTHKQRLTIS